MLAKQHRLRKNRDFSTVYNRGIRCHSSDLSLRAYRRPDKFREQPARLGICVSRKVSKRAVCRNRVKRRLREACRLLLPQLSMGWDGVIVVRSSAMRCDYHQFLQQLKQLFTEAELLDGRY